MVAYELIQIFKCDNIYFHLLLLHQTLKLEFQNLIKGISNALEQGRELKGASGCCDIAPSKVEKSMLSQVVSRI